MVCHGGAHQMMKAWWRPLLLERSLSRDKPQVVDQINNSQEQSITVLTLLEAQH